MSATTNKPADNKLTPADVVSHPDFRFVTIASLKSIGFKKDFDEPIQNTALSILYNGVGDENLSLTTIIYNHARWANAKRKRDIQREEKRPLILNNWSALENYIDSRESNTVESLDFAKVVMNGLPKRKSHILKRFFYENIGQTEIADELGITSQSVSEQIRFFCKKVKKDYENTSRKNLSNCG